jgi:hypothetical protein
VHIDGAESKTVGNHLTAERKRPQRRCNDTGAGSTQERVTRCVPLTIVQYTELLPVLSLSEQRQPTSLTRLLAEPAT